METLEQYNETFHAEDREIIEEVRNSESGQILPEEGPAKFFYDNVNYEGQSFILMENNSPVIFYVEHDNVIQAIDPEKCKWHIEPEASRTVLTMINDDKFAGNITFTFIHRDRVNLDALKSIRSEQKIEIIFLSPIHGGFTKEKSCSFDLPEHIFDKL